MKKNGYILEISDIAILLLFSRNQHLLLTKPMFLEIRV